MLLRYKLYVIFLFCTLNLSAKKELKYPASQIPAELTEGADAVIREMNTNVEVFSPEKVVYDTKYVITILKESGKDKALFHERYDKFSSISNISATVYDSEGNKVKSIPQNEIGDFASVSGFSLYEDSRVKVIDPKYSVYPYTVEYTFQQKYNSAYYIGGWSALQGYNTSIESFNFKLKAPSDFKYHFKEYNLDQPGEKEIKEDELLRIWAIKNYKAIQKELLSSFSEDYIPEVVIVPDQFVMDGYTGRLSTWNDFGLYINKLNEGKNDIPQETVAKVRAMFEEGMSDYEKIAIAYKYSQDKNRYVSIQEGIGGHQPFSAETVDRLSYGDCKALSNYVVSLLKELGYDAHYTLVYSGEGQNTDKEFVNDYFNHIIACVPLENDTIWLECTSSHYPCGYMGGSTDDRNVLLVKDNGGEIVKTPSYSVNDDIVFTKTTVNISIEDASKVKSHIVYKGVHFSEELGLTLMDETDRRKSIIRSINIPNFELDSYKVTPYRERKPRIEKDLDILIPVFGSMMGDRLIFQLNLMNQLTNTPPYSRNRVSPVLISRPYSENDSIAYNIPEGFKMEALPKEVHLVSEFGEYHSSAKLIDQSIVYEREFIINKGHYPKEKYNDFVEFVESVSKNDEAKAVLIKI